MKCFFCHTEISKESEVCTNCSRELSKECLSCQILYEDDANFCSGCGGKLQSREKTYKRPDNIMTLEIELDEIMEDLEPLTEEEDSEILVLEEIEIQDPVSEESSEEEIPVVEEEELLFKAKEILPGEIKKPLSCHEVPSFYKIDEDPLLNHIREESFSPSLESFFRGVLGKMEQGRGGISFIKGNSGQGKSLFANELSASSESWDNCGFNLVVSHVDSLGFDYTLFAGFLRSLMGVTGDSSAKIREKVEDFFGDMLPRHKKECLVALLALNFLPLKEKLPKNDLDYLLVFLLYRLCRIKPVLWVVSNASELNTRALRFIEKVASVLSTFPLSIVLLTEPGSEVCEMFEEKGFHSAEFLGPGEERMMSLVQSHLGTDRIPVEIEKIVRKVSDNLLYVFELVQLLKDLGVVFNMRGSWRFAKLPDDFELPESVEELILTRLSLLDSEEITLLNRLTLLGVPSIPKRLFTLVFNDYETNVLQRLVDRGYVEEKSEFIAFKSYSLFNTVRRSFSISEKEKLFYRDVVLKLSSTNVDITPLNRNWLLLSYINLGGVVDKRFNSFLFSSALYMERLAFFEIAERCYQTILLSIDDVMGFDDFRILLETKSARLFRFTDPEWAKVYWKKLNDLSAERGLHQLELLSRAELLLMDSSRIDVQEIVKIVKELHTAGCFENEIAILDRLTDLLMDSGNYFDANTFALRSYKIVKDIFNDKRFGSVDRDDVVLVLYIKSACKLGEVNISLKYFDYAVDVLNEALNMAMLYNIPYFQAKSMYLLGKIQYVLEEDWEEYIRKSFELTISEMQFSVLKSFFHFFEDENLESKGWVESYLEHKNWINIT